MRSLAALGVALMASLSYAAAPPPQRVDLHGDPLPAGALSRLGTVRLRHGHMVSSVAFSADGKTLVSGASDHTVRIWNAATGRLVRCIGKEHSLVNVYAGSRWITAVAISGDGKSVASCSNDGMVRIWNVATGEEVRSIRLGWATPSLAFGAGGKTPAATGGSIVFIWDVATGKEVHRLVGHRFFIPRMGVSTDGAKLVSGDGQGVVCLWDAGTGKQVRQLSLGQGASAVAISPDGKTVAAASINGKVVLWDAGTGQERRQLAAHKRSVAGLAFLPGNKTLVSVQVDGLIRLWEIETGKMVRQIEQQGTSVLTMALSRDGKKLALVSGNGLQLWDLQAGRRIGPPGGHDGAVAFLTFSGKGGRVTTAGGDGMFRIWEAATGKPGRASGPTDTTCSPTALSASGRVAAGLAPAGEVILWDVQAGKMLRKIADAKATGTAALSDDGRTLATASQVGEVRLWDVATGKELRKFAARQGVLLALAFSPDGEVLASSGGNGLVRLWRVKTGRELRQVNVRGVAYRLVFSSDGRALASGGHDPVVRVWETATGQLVRELSGHRGYVMALAFSPDGRHLAAGNWMGVRLWDLATGKARGELLGYQGDGVSLGFSPDGKVLASAGSDLTVLLWGVSGMLRPDRDATDRPRPTAEALAAKWDNLAATDGRKAYDAVWELAAAPAQAVGLFSKHLKPVRPADAKRLARLIADLGDEEFETRSKAARELEALEDLAGAALRKALARTTDVDLRLRLQVLLGRLDSDELSGEQLRTMRALQVLEVIGTRAARRLLGELAKGAATARLTREAQASIRRLTRR
jgi:WD40 repeat protein